MEISVYLFYMTVNNPDFVCVNPITGIFIFELTLVKHSVLNLKNSVRLSLPLKLIFRISCKVILHLVSIHYFVESLFYSFLPVFVIKYYLTFPRPDIVPIFLFQPLIFLIAPEHLNRLARVSTLNILE